MYKIYWTEDFFATFSKRDNSEKLWIPAQEVQLQQSVTGKPLGMKWCREKKAGDRRLYFLYSDTNRVVLFVAYGSKGEQKAMVREIRADMENYLRILNNLRGDE